MGGKGGAMSNREVTKHVLAAIQQDGGKLESCLCCSHKDADETFVA